MGEAAKKPKEVKYLPFNFTVTILATANLNGNIIDWDYSIPKTADIGMAKTFTIIKQERLANSMNLLFDAGDSLYGSRLTDYYAFSNSNTSRIHPVVKAENFMMYDGIVLGEKEFDYGQESLINSLSQSNAKLLAANVFNAKGKKPFPQSEPYMIKTFQIGDSKSKAKINIGIIGVTTPAILNLNNSQNYTDISIENQVATVKEYVKKLKKKKVDAIIVVAHSGVDADSSTVENQIVAIAENCPEINLIISGHKPGIIDESTPIYNSQREQIYDKGVINGVSILAPGQNGQYVGKASLLFEMFGRKYYIKKVNTTNISTAGVAPDRDLLNILWPYHDSTLQHLSAPIGNINSEFTDADTQLKNLGLVNLINDVQLQASKAQLSAASSFGLNPEFDKGIITNQDANSLYRFESYLYSIEVTGKQLKQYLEHAARYYKTFKEDDRIIRVGGENNEILGFNYDVVKGVDYTIDISKAPGERIKDITYNGNKVNDEDTFTLAINSFRYNGSGGYMTAMGFNADNPPIILFDSQKAFGNFGQVKELIASYIKSQDSISPTTPTNITISTGPYTPVETKFHNQ